jgi:hypothetical protein
MCKSGCVSMTGFKIEEVSGEDQLREFCLFADEVNSARSAYWPSMTDMQLPLLTGTGHEAAGRKVLPLAAKEGERIVAKAVAVVDQRYIDHWDEPLGHIIMFEALPDTTDAVRALMNEACAWLRENDMSAARTGFGPALDLPYLLDNYEPLPAPTTRHNPAYYHFLLKEARFEAEKGWVDYTIEATDERQQLWSHMLKAAETAGFRIATMSELGEGNRIAHFNQVWEESFDRHWGWSPQSLEEWDDIFGFLGPIGGYDLSVLAYQGDEPVGTVLGIPDLSMIATLAPGRELKPEERLGLLGIGVCEKARGRGVNLAMAARNYLEQVNRGNEYVSYTMVLDDNWPSRRTAEKLGGRVRANYLVYRREFAKR